MTQVTYYKCNWCKFEGKNLGNWIFIPEIRLPYIEDTNIQHELAPEIINDLSFCSYDHMIKAIQWYVTNRGGEKSLPK
jgi:hypothetical protein